MLVEFMNGFDPALALLPIAAWLLFGLALNFIARSDLSARKGALDRALRVVLAFGSGLLVGLVAAVVWIAVQVIEPFAPLITHMTSFDPTLALLPIAGWLLVGLALAFSAPPRLPARGNAVERIISVVLAFGSCLLLALVAAVLWAAIQVLEPFIWPQ